MTYLLPNLPEGYEFQEKGFFGTAFSPLIEAWYGWRTQKAWERHDIASRLSKDFEFIHRRKLEYERLRDRHLHWHYWLMAYEEKYRAPNQQ